MKKVKTNNRVLVLTILFMVVLSCLLTFTTYAYFKFQKVYEGAGNLPILNIDYNISTGNKESLKNITYNGQVEENIKVNITTTDNNISGYVRVYVGIVWENSLNNTPYDDNNDIIVACSIDYDSNVWKLNGNYYYLTTALEQNSEKTFFSKIKFGELPNEYRGAKVSIYLIAQIFQTNNLPSDWQGVVHG